MAFGKHYKPYITSHARKAFPKSGLSHLLRTNIPMTASSSSLGPTSANLSPDYTYPTLLYPSLKLVYNSILWIW